SLGHTLFELRYQNRAARTRTAPQSKTSRSGTARTKKCRAEPPSQKSNGWASAINSRGKVDASCKPWSSRKYEPPRARGRYQSCQPGQTVNLLALRFRWFESSPAHILPMRVYRALSSVQRIKSPANEIR